jgi:hypothetical protein
MRFKYFMVLEIEIFFLFFKFKNIFFTLSMHFLLCVLFEKQQLCVDDYHQKN